MIALCISSRAPTVAGPASLARYRLQPKRASPSVIRYSRKESPQSLESFCNSFELVLVRSLRAGRRQTGGWVRYLTKH